MRWVRTQTEAKVCHTQFLFLLFSATLFIAGNTYTNLLTIITITVIIIIITIIIIIIIIIIGSTHLVRILNSISIFKDQFSVIEKSLNMMHDSLVNQLSGVYTYLLPLPSFLSFHKS
jgi:hypothetical protein